MNLKKMRAASRGFTLLELLIVISIIAILSVALILTINPAETLKKSRDAQRISDLSTLKTALGLVLTASSTPYLAANNTDCLQGGSAAKVYYSLVGSTGCGTGNTTLGLGTDANGNFATAGSGSAVCRTTTTAAAGTDGNGWVPVNFSWLPGGSPISNLPLDPTNSVSGSTATSTDFVYRYACQSTGSGAKPGNVFEIDATLESTAYTVTDNKRDSDGGDSAVYYETGTDLRLLPQWGI